MGGGLREISRCSFSISQTTKTKVVHELSSSSSDFYACTDWQKIMFPAAAPHMFERKTLLEMQVVIHPARGRQSVSVCVWKYYK